MRKRKIKSLIKYLGMYVSLIASIIGLRLLHGMDIPVNYFITISIVIFSFLILFFFIEPKHIERVLPKNSKLSLIAVLILRFLPLSKQKIINIKNNQEMRGAKFKGLRQLKYYISLLIPAVIVAIKWADNLSEGLRMRGGD